MRNNNKSVNMNAILNLRSAGAVLTPDEASASAPGTISSERKVSGALQPIGMRACFSYAAALLHEVALVFVLLYSLGAVAFGVALMFHTFSR
jgi:hypothetical protein